MRQEQLSVPFTDKAEKLSDTNKVTQLIRNEAKIKTQVV